MYKKIIYAILSVQVTNYLQEIAPDLCDRVKLYKKRTPLFNEYNIEEEMNNILCKRWETTSIVLANIYQL